MRRAGIAGLRDQMAAREAQNKLSKQMEENKVAHVRRRLHAGRRVFE